MILLIVLAITSLFEVLRTINKEKSFFVEESIAIATKFYEKRRSKENRWKEKYILT